MRNDKNRFWELLRPEHCRVEAFCRKLMGNRDDGDDLYQEALLAAMRGFDSLRDESAFRSWLYRIVINVHKNRCRQTWWRRLVPLSAEAVESQHVSDPTESYAARRWVHRAFQALKAPERAMVTLFELEGWSIAELAQLYERPEGTVKARLLRARRRMRKEIERYLPADNNYYASCEADYALPQNRPSSQ
jgi:RNA polymerase sigma-70 factor (ECF subfamily)